MSEAKGEYSGAIATPDPQPPICIGCGYELTGLALDCTCPECGLKRNPQMIVIRGFATGKRLTSLTGRAETRFAWWQLGLLLLLLSFYFCVILLTGGFSRSIGGVFGTTINTIASTAMLAYAYHRQKHEGHLPIHAIFHPDGVCQRSKFGGELKLTPWDDSYYYEIGEAKGGYRTVKITKSNFLAFCANMAKYQPVAIEFMADEKCIESLRALLGSKL